MPSLQAFGQDIWIADGESVSVAGFHYPTRMAIIRLGDGVNPWNWLYKKILIHTPGLKENGSLLYAICVIIFMWAICYWMDKKKMYVKV